MFWLIYCGLFVLMLISIFRMLLRQGKWAWGLFLGLLASVAGYIALFVLPVASAPALQNRRVLLTVILIGGTLIYISGIFYCIRRIATKLRSENPPL